MAYKTLMVHVQPGRPNTGLLQAAADLVRRFQARVTGIAMSQPMRIIYSEGYIPGDLIARDREEREQELATAEAEFRDVMKHCAAEPDWRGAITDEPLSDYFAREARCADLIVTGVDQEGSLLDNTRHLDIGAFVLDVGRPVLIVPKVVQTLKFGPALVGWKDTRETRRAISDALPFLAQASHVIVAEIAPETALAAAKARLEEVRAWLARHGIEAETVVSPSRGEDAHQLHALALEHRAEVIVAGAYGHSRVREWVLGGVTRDLLLRAGRCALVSH